MPADALHLRTVYLIPTRTLDLHCNVTVGSTDRIDVRAIGLFGTIRSLTSICRFPRPGPRLHNPEFTNSELHPTVRRVPMPYKLD